MYNVQELATAALHGIRRRRDRLCRWRLRQCAAMQKVDYGNRLIGVDLLTELPEKWPRASAIAGVRATSPDDVGDANWPRH